MEEHLRDLIQLSLGSTPEKMLERALQACIDISGSTGGSILGEEGPYLQFLFSDQPQLKGMRVPLDSIAGETVRKGVIIYTYAPSDHRHFSGIDRETRGITRYLLSIPIPSIHQNATEQARRSTGVLQLLFDKNIFPEMAIEEGAREFDVDVIRDNQLYEKRLKHVFWLLPNVAFGMEVLNLRQTSYHAIHELKNKFISALSWINYLKDDLRSLCPQALDNDGVTEDFALAESSIREGSALAKTYLVFTKIYEPDYAEGDLNGILREVAASARALGRERNMEDFQVALELDDGIPPRRLDSAKLKMAFFNLCKNAIEALADHDVAEPVVSIRSRLDDDSILVTVSDNGPGMPQEIADNLFIPFKTKKEGGTGLGLTITKKIVDIHDGRIQCKTGPAGTTFTVTIQISARS